MDLKQSIYQSKQKKKGRFSSFETLSSSYKFQSRINQVIDLPYVTFKTYEHVLIP